MQDEPRHRELGSAGFTPAPSPRPKPSERSTSAPATPYWDGVAEHWIGLSRGRVWRRHADVVNAALLERWFPLSGLRTVLKTDLFEEAVGDGVYRLLRRHAVEVKGIDVSLQVVEAARRRNPDLDAVRADVRALPFPDASFDAAVSLSTLDHFADESDISVALSELWRVLTPRGRLMITLDNASNPVLALRNRLPFQLVHAVGLVPYFVGVTCSVSSLPQALRAVEFEVRELTCILHCPRVAAVLASRLVERSNSVRLEQRFRRLLLRFERLERSRAAARTGYFVAALAIKR